MSADNTSLRLLATVSAAGATSTFFEVKGIYRPAAVRRCDVRAAGTAARVDANAWSLTDETDSYSATTLTQSVKVVLDKPLSVKEGPLEICVELVAPKSMLPPRATGRGGYVGLRLRAHRLKAMMDLELHSPQQVAMPLVVAVNSAARIDAAVRRGDYAKANAEMASFDDQIDASLAAMANTALTGQRRLSAHVKAVATAWLK